MFLTLFSKYYNFLWLTSGDFDFRDFIFWEWSQKSLQYESDVAEISCILHIKKKKFKKYKMKLWFILNKFRK